MDPQRNKMKKKIHNNFSKRVVLVSSSILVLGIAGLAWYIINFLNNIVETSALESDEFGKF